MHGIKATLARLGLYSYARHLWRLGWAVVKPSYRKVVKTDGRLKSLYAQFVRRGQLCYDVGTNYGDWTQIFLDLGAEVVSIEPQKRCVDHLIVRYGTNRRVHLVQQALAPVPGTMTLYVDARLAGIATISKEFMDFGRKTYDYRQYEESYEVSVTTLDALIETYGKPDFIKIDVEGAELSVLQGLSQPISALSFEYHPKLADMAKACVSRLAAMGTYEFNFTVSDEHILKLDHWVGPREMTELIQSRISRLSSDVSYGDIYARLRHET